MPAIRFMKVRVARDHDATCGVRAEHELVVIGIYSDRWRDARVSHQCSMPEEGRQELSVLKAGVSGTKSIARPKVFVEDQRGEHQLEATIRPSLENTLWQAAEEDPRNQHVRVEDSLHFFARASRMARSTSFWVIPAAVADC